MALPPRIGAMSTGDGMATAREENGEFCVAVALRPGPLVSDPVSLRCWLTKQARDPADLGYNTALNLN